ncbi:TPA: restriction endonuclease subunit S [Streptococcus suis]|nr:restriction endonuclease subunit S [Streptococcus suis]HEM5187663.1 restriction endonuclease subunit S [Streptococcus suis]HEM5671563.1 restriction endonuclease subunit S [Streptococcus suis]
MTKEKSTVPRLRFPGFTTTWKQRKFSDLAEVRRGLTYSPSAIRNHGVRVLRSSNINEDTFVFGEDDVFVDKSVVKIPLVEEGDILITSANGSSRLVGKHSIIKGLPSNSAIHGGFMLLASSKVPCFLNAFMSSTWYHKFIGLYVAGGNGAIGNLNKSDLDEQIVLVPTLPEQEAIGSFFSDLDQLITLHQRKLDDVKELKKALLQKMFPKGNGNDFPELRFPEFTDAWKQRKLGEVGYAKSGVGFPEKEQGGTTGIPFFKVSDMNTNGNENELVVANNYVTDEQISKRKWRVITEVPAIFFAKVGAAVMLNRKRLIRHPFLLDNNTMTYVFNHTQWDTNFGKTLFETIDLIQLTQVGALPSYNSSDVENINISLPTLPEQEAIGSFFSDLDQLITLHQRQLDHLKLLKKALLQQMFI